MTRDSEPQPRMVSILRFSLPIESFGAFMSHMGAQKSQPIRIYVYLSEHDIAFNLLFFTEYEEEALKMVRDFCREHEIEMEENLPPQA